MTAARWVSLIIGCLITPLNFSSEGIPPCIWDFLIVMAYKASAAALVIVPLILEYKERKGK